MLPSVTGIKLFTCEQTNLIVDMCVAMRYDIEMRTPIRNWSSMQSTGCPQCEAAHVSETPKCGNEVDYNSPQVILKEEPWFARPKNSKQGSQVASTLASIAYGRRIVWQAFHMAGRNHGSWKLRLWQVQPSAGVAYYRHRLWQIEAKIQPLAGSPTCLEENNSHGTC